MSLNWRNALAMAAVGMVSGLVTAFFVVPAQDVPRHFVFDKAECARTGRDGYYRVDSHVCYGASGSPIDAGSFRSIGTGFAVDATSVYWLGSPIIGADPASFVVISEDRSGSAYAKDRYRAYIALTDANPPYGSARAIERADPDEFEILDEGPGFVWGYARDQDQVWLFGEPVKGADAATFHLVLLGGNFDAQDASGGYWHGQVVK